MWHAGLRGAIAWALAIKFPSQNRDLVVLITMSVILFTSYAQGGSTGALLSFLGLRNAAEGDGSSSGSGGKEYVANSDGEDEDQVQLATATGAQEQKHSKLPRWMRSLERFHEKKMQPLFVGKSAIMKQPLHAQGQRHSPLSSVDEAGGSGPSSGLSSGLSLETGGGGIQVVDSDEAAI